MLTKDVSFDVEPLTYLTICPIQCKRFSLRHLKIRDGGYTMISYYPFDENDGFEISDKLTNYIHELWFFDRDNERKFVYWVSPEHFNGDGGVILDCIGNTYFHVEGRCEPRNDVYKHYQIFVSDDPLRLDFTEHEQFQGSLDWSIEFWFKFWVNPTFSDGDFI